MRYLFFDTECSNEFEGIHKMCEWGEISCDEFFHVLPNSKKDILMSPGRNYNDRFALPHWKGSKPLLSHRYSEYKASPEFPIFYKQIKDNLEEKDTLVFLWASDNDVTTLLDSEDRYKKNHAHYVSYDVQRLFMRYYKDKSEKHSLEDAYEYFYKDDKESMRAHNPADDAHMTLLVLKAIIKDLDKDLPAILEENPSAKIDSIEYVEKVQERAKSRLIKAEFAGLSSKNPYDDILISFGVSGRYYKSPTEIMDIAKKAIEKGYRLHDAYSKCSFVVSYNDTDKERLERLDIIKANNIEVLSLEEFKNKILKD